VSPFLEFVGIQERESFKIWTHGYPYVTVRWHFHPEYELNLITETSGRYFVGDHTGTFEPGQLCMMGPNLPHNWVSEVPDNRPVERRCVVLQFSGKSITRGIAAFPELGHIERLLADSQRGILFSPAVAQRGAALMHQLLDAQGFARVPQFLTLLDLLARAPDCALLATPEFRADPESYPSRTINQVLAYIAQHLGERLRESDIAHYAGMETTAFSRFFRRHTGTPFVQRLNRMRVKQACEWLIGTERSITEICYGCGFNNVSNFNRQFQAQKSMSPSQFRRYHRLNAACTLPD
jgi:AraC-like DNA-binding protein